MVLFKCDERVMYTWFYLSVMKGGTRKADRKWIERKNPGGSGDARIRKWMLTADQGKEM